VVGYTKLPAFPLTVTYVAVCPTPNLLDHFAAVLFKAGRKHPGVAQWDRGEIERGYLLPLWPPALNGTFLSTTAARQRLDPLYLFAGLFINGCVGEVDVPVQARVRVVLVVISLRSGSSVALLGPKTRGEVSNTALVARGTPSPWGRYKRL